MKLKKSFFEGKDTVTLARELLGKVITKVTPEGNISGIINEVEAYTQDDEASHCFGAKKSLRNQVMFLEHGHLYVYFTYGMHYCMNIVSEREGYGSGILIRSVIPYEGVDIMIKNRKRGENNTSDLTNGPAKVCQAFGITQKENGLNLLQDDSFLYLEDIGYKLPEIHVSKRIGISKAKEREWRFWF